MNRMSLNLVICVVVSTVVLPSVAEAQFAVVRRSLTQHYDIDNIRVFYNTSGDHAVDPTDSNNNGVPDRVEDTAKQSWAAARIFIDTLGFPDPLESERYKEAKYIDVNLLARETITINGMAYDGLQKIGRSIDEPGTRTICFDVATSVQPTKNITAAHEVFHLIQNGCTFFKTRWYTEGMARWAEHALKSGGVGETKYPLRGPWPQSDRNLNQLAQMAYESEFVLWNPLAKLDDKRGIIPSKAVAQDVKDLTYTNGEPVLEDMRLNGAEFMKEVLLELGKLDDTAFERLGYEKWSEPNQKSLKNSPYIYKAIMDVARRRGHKVGRFRTTR